MYTNPSAVEIQRKKLSMQQLIKSKIDYSAETKRKPYTFSRDFSHYDCQLPAFKSMPKKLQELYAAFLLDSDMMSDLTATQLLNWSTGTTQLVAVGVPRDGNCLLHAASVAVWGVDDSLHVLRELLLITITNDFDDRFKSRWRRRRVQEMRAIAQTSTQVIESEWADIVGSVSPTPVSTAVAHKFLEPIHIYVLANILRRPILVVADSLAKSVSGLSLQESTMAGIYLPLEWRPEECCPTPIILGYSLSHFCPLLTQVPTSGEERIIPLVTNNLDSLPILFLTEEEELKAWQLVQMYFQTREFTNNGISIPCAQLDAHPVEKIASNVLIELFKSWEQAVNQESSTGSIVECQQHIGPPSLRIAASLQPLSPTAPPASGLYLEAEPMSMLASRCISKCGYRCSSTTFPYCHLCWTLEQDKRKQSQLFLTPTAPFSISQLSIQVSSTTGSEEMNPPHISSLGHTSFVTTGSSLVAQPAEVSGLDSPRAGSTEALTNCLDPQSIEKNPGYSPPSWLSENVLRSNMFLPEEGTKSISLQHSQILQPALTGVNNLSPLPGQILQPALTGVNNLSPLPGPQSHGQVRGRGKACVTAGCPHFGDPAEAGMCSSCYRGRPRLGPAQKHLTMDHPLPNVTSHLLVCSGSHHSGVEATSNEVSFKLKQFSLKAEPAESLQSSPHLITHLTPHLTGTKPITGQTPLNLPVGQTPLNLPVGQTPLNLPVGQVGQTPLNLPVGQTPLNLPVGQTPLNLPAGQTPLNLPARNKNEDTNILGLQLVKCRMSHCQNYGSLVKKGYCNACFSVYREQSLLLHNAKFGQDVPDFSQ